MAKVKKTSKNPAKKVATKKRAQKPSAGSKDLEKIFSEIKSLMIPYQKTLVSRVNTNKGFDLWSEKKVEFMGRERNDVYFVGLMIKSNYVGFYYMPVYISDEFKKVFKHPELLKTLKGKSCFHIKTSDPLLMRQIKEALEIGYAMYKKRGWV